ncbi:unnamed protein product, partial [Ectocarpus fasciculatus]
ALSSSPPAQGTDLPKGVRSIRARAAGGLAARAYVKLFATAARRLLIEGTQDGKCCVWPPFRRRRGGRLLPREPGDLLMAHAQRDQADRRGQRVDIPTGPEDVPADSEGVGAGRGEEPPDAEAPTRAGLPRLGAAGDGVRDRHR